ncbi:hypothetical protein ACG33_11595 [Steroidobacter denitrificans]|uniref:Uncharacterized protein n=1 Tax=Steroidobacter denitrificans TaxID=465721 RepID=A0A127FDC6_STEDE|nr:hypothetical protein ACG33_11595 [Steroidobacter denitrificans]
MQDCPAIGLDVLFRSGVRFGSAVLVLRLREMYRIYPETLIDESRDDRPQGLQQFQLLELGEMRVGEVWQILAEVFPGSVRVRGRLCPRAWFQSGWGWRVHARSFGSGIESPQSTMRSWRMPIFVALAFCASSLFG